MNDLNKNKIWTWNTKILGSLNISHMKLPDDFRRFSCWALLNVNDSSNKHKMDLIFFTMISHWSWGEVISSSLKFMYQFLSLTDNIK